MMRPSKHLQRIVVTSCHLRELRETAGLTIRELAKKCGVSEGRVQTIESRLPDLGVATALVIAAALGVKVEDIWTAALEFDNE